MLRCRHLGFTTSSAAGFCRRQQTHQAVGWFGHDDRHRQPVIKAILRARAVAQEDPQAVDGDGPAPGQRITGRKRRLPSVQPPDEMFNAVMKEVRRVGPREDIRKEPQRSANKAARAIDTLIKGLSSRLNKAAKSFPVFQALHPFEQVLLDLTIGDGNYARILRKVQLLRKAVSKVGKDYAAQASRATSPSRAEALEGEAVEAISGALQRQGQPVLREAQKMSAAIRRLPQIDMWLPTLALVGAPNVGKSSLVNELSTGEPEVCNYPFTTRTIKMGHFYVDGSLHQVTDTPGLLPRTDSDRNAMELVTLAALQHLPTAAVFVIDATEDCGCSVQEQWTLRSELLRRFPDKLWIDVFSKGDLLEEELDEAAQRKEQPQEGDVVPQDAVQLIRWLPDACISSCVADGGTDSVKGSILKLMQDQAWRARIDAVVVRDEQELNTVPSEQ